MFTTPLQVFEFLQRKFENETEFVMEGNKHQVPVIRVSLDPFLGKASSICLGLQTLRWCQKIPDSLHIQCSEIIKKYRPTDANLFWFPLDVEGHRQRAKLLKKVCEDLRKGNSLS